MPRARKNRNDMIEMPRTIGGQQEEIDDGLDGYDDGLEAAAQDDIDDGLEDEIDDGLDDGNDDYDTSGEVATLRAENERLRQQSQLLGAGTGGTDGDLDLSDLPDAVTKPEDFKKHLAEKVNGAVRAGINRTAQAVTAQQTQDNIRKLETDFRTQYPQLSKKSALLRAATIEEANAIRARGLDPQTVMFGQSDKFLKKVAARMYSELGVKEKGDEQLMRRQQQNNGRTRGVSGGTRTPGAPRKSGQDNGKPVPFVKQILQNQQKLGLI